MSISRVIIVHGYSATPADHWFDSLSAALSAEGIDVSIPALPGTESPELDAWTRAVADAIGTPDSDTAIVAHSLGGVTALHALDSVPGDWRLGAFIAVAGFIDPLPALPELDAFTASGPDVRRTAARAETRAVLLSDEDTFVPTDLTRALGALLDAAQIEVPGAGHFLGSDGVTELPEALGILVHADVRA